MESSKVKESSDVAKNDMEVTVAKANRSSDPGDSLHAVEGGKKDPSIRRQELLVKSGLAEVCYFIIINVLIEFSNIFQFNSFQYCTLLLLILNIFGQLNDQKIEIGVY